LPDILRDYGGAIPASPKLNPEFQEDKLKGNCVEEIIVERKSQPANKKKITFPAHSLPDKVNPALRLNAICPYYTMIRSRRISPRPSTPVIPKGTFHFIIPVKTIFDFLVNM